MIVQGTLAHDPNAQHNLKGNNEPKMNRTAMRVEIWSFDSFLSN